MRYPLYKPQANTEHLFSNSLFRAFFPQLKEAWALEVFGSNSDGTKRKFGQPLTKEKAERLYVVTRDDRDDHHHEESLLAALDPPAHRGRGQVLTVLGKAGIGKTTLLDYYFSWFRRRALEAQSRPTEAMVLYVSVRWAQDLVQTVYERLTAVISEEFGRVKRLEGLAGADIRRFDDYAMWARRGGFESMLLTSEEKRRLAIQYMGSDHREFVKEALWYITSPESPLQPKWPVFVIIDNIDQTALVEQQKEILNLALSWLESGTLGETLRVLLPLRPETLSRIRGLVEPIEDKVDQLPLTAVDLNEVMAKRVAVFENEAGEIDDLRLINYTVCQSFGKVLVHLEHDEAVASVAGMMRATVDESLEVLPGVEAPKSVENFYVNFCNGSVRRHISIRRRITRSAGVLARLRGRAGQSMSQYAFFDSFLSAGQRFFNAYDEDNDVINLFSLFHSDRPGEECCQLLIGVHLLDVLRAAANINGVRERLMSIGYPRELVDAALEVFETKGLIHTPPYDGNGYELESSICDAHLQLLKEPAYVDNMAMVTPVPTKTIRRMQRTVGHDNTQFAPRVESTVSFLAYLRDMELVFSDAGRRPLLGCDQTTLNARIVGSGIKPVLVRVTRTYVERLRVLRDNPHYLPNIPRDHFERWIQHPVFRANPHHGGGTQHEHGR